MKSAESNFVRQALLQETVDEEVRCGTCEGLCCIPAGSLGWCKTRRNQNGTLVTLIYGAVSSLSVNPIEKKPFYHFYPGTLTLTAGSWSCNFACPWCQNWDISKVSPPRRGDSLSPEGFVELALLERCPGTSISFNEPTLSMEWSLAAFRLARGRGRGHIQQPAQDTTSGGRLAPDMLTNVEECRPRRELSFQDLTPLRRQRSVAR